MPNNSCQLPYPLPIAVFLVAFSGAPMLTPTASAQEVGASRTTQETAQKAEETAQKAEETATPAEDPASLVEYWAGKLTVIGYRRIPFLGKVEFRTSNSLIATVTQRGGRVDLDQKVCSIDFEKVFGAKLYIDPAAPPRMHRARPSFEALPDGSFKADFWTSGWDAADLDKDGNPGVSINVRAPLCGGDVFMESNARSEARAMPWHGALAGEIRVEVEQKVLGTQGACLAFMAKDHTQWLHGFVAYEPLEGPRECDAMENFSWPDYEADPPNLPESTFSTNEK